MSIPIGEKRRIHHVSAGTYSSTTTGETFPLSLKSYVSLQGADASNTVLDGENTASQILSGNGAKGITIEGFTLKRTQGQSTNGGGIYLENASATIRNNVVTDHTGQGYGGGIYVKDSSVILHSNQITNNSASYGGGIYFVNSEISDRDNTITGNSTSHHGGGVYGLNSNASFFESRIKDNTASEKGGGFYLDNTPAWLDKLAITGNIAAQGGGIFGTDSPPSPRESDIYNNIATSGDGSDELYYNGTGTLSAQSNYWGTSDQNRIAGRIFDPNKIDISPISANPLCTSPPIVTVTPFTNDRTNDTTPTFTGTASDATRGNANITSVECQIDGMSPNNWTTATITSGSGTPSVQWTFTSTTVLSAGTHILYVRATDADGYTNLPERYNFTVQVLTQVSGGVISSDLTWGIAGSPYIVMGNVIVESGATLTIEAGVIIKFNSEKGLQVNGTLVARGLISDYIVFTSNQASPAVGDWLFINFTDSSSDATFDGRGNYTGGSILQYCKVEYGGGSGATGAIQLDSASPYIDHCEIKSNAASGVRADNAQDLRITNSTISDNTDNDDSYRGGGIYISSGTVTITNNTISGNTAASQHSGGGGIYVLSGNVTITNNTISDNWGNNRWLSGGGIHASGTVTITNNTISGNMGGGENSGGGIYASGTVTITNNTISGNTGGGEHNGAGIYASGTVTITDNIIGDNTSNGGARGGSGGIYVSSGTATITNNTINGNTGGGSNYGGTGSGFYRAIGESNYTNQLMEQKGGIYCLWIPANVTGNGVEYYIQAEDSGGNVRATLPEENPSINPYSLSAVAILQQSVQANRDNAFEFAAGVTIEIPAGALSSDTNLQVSPLSTSPTPPSGVTATDIGYNLTMEDGTSTFAQPVSISFNYSDSDVQGLDESTLRVYYWNGSAWVLAGGTVDADSNRISVQTNHFTDFAMFGSQSSGVVISEIRESNHTNSKVTISWITDTATTGSVNWGVSEGSLNNTANDERGESHSDDTHYVTITGLSASTTYYYQVVSGDATSSTDSFTTAATGTGSQHTLDGDIKKQDGVTAAEGAIVYVTVTSGGVTSQRLSDLTDSNGSWQVDLEDLKKPDGSVLGYNTGDAIYVFAQGAADGTSTYDDTVSANNPQRIPASGDLSLPVELSIFTATSIDNGVLLSWRTETEVNNVGFAIYRSEGTAGEDVAGQSHAATSGKYTKIAFLSGAGNSGVPKDYQFIDEGAEPGKTYFYYLEDIDIAGERNKSKIIKVVLQHDQPGLTIPKEFRLLQNYPNPFNPETWLPYQLARSADVIIRIYNIKGELIRTINLGTKNAGVYTSKNKSAHWNGRNQTGELASSGVYFYQIKAGNFIATRKMILLK